MKVLVVDGGRSFQELIRSLFERSGLSVDACDSGAACAAALREQEYSFICISMYLPDTNGIELCSAIRDMPNYRHVPVILFTSEHSGQLLGRAIEAGVTEIFDKSKDIAQIVAYTKRFSQLFQPMAGRVLYVEDMASLREHTTTVLESKGLCVDAVDTAEAAWASFEQNYYDLVITDILLAGEMSGLELVNKIRRLDDRRGDVPLLAVTGFDDVARKIELFHLGVDDYLAKPILAEELLARVRNLIARFQATESQISLIRNVFDCSSDGMAILDYQGRIEQFNAALLGMLGVDAHLERRSLASLRGPEHNAISMEEIWRAVDGAGQWSGNFSLKGESGGVMDTRFELRRMACDAASLSRYIGIWRPLEVS